MSEMNDGGPVAPMLGATSATGLCGPAGISLRDWFAGMALAARLGNPAVNFRSKRPPKVSEAEALRRMAVYAEVNARKAYATADAMIERRSL